MNETARRAKQRCGKMIRHVIGLGHQVRDLTPDLRGLLEVPQVEHHAALTDPRQVGAVLLETEAYEGRFITGCALRLAPGAVAVPPTVRALVLDSEDVVVKS